MDKVFDPSELELADSRGDPGRVVEIQKLIQEFLGASRQRQQGIRAQLLEQGAWALPGLLNATYVWMNQLEDMRSQKTLSSLMADLASDNPAAVDLLFRNGVLETPFPAPRSIARMALEQLGWIPNDLNCAKLVKSIVKYDALSDTQAVLDYYAILLKRGTPQDFSSALTKCKDWARRALEAAGDLLALMVKQFPDRVEETLSEVFLAVREDYRDRNIAEVLLSPLRPIPPAWLEDGVVLNVSQKVFLQMPRHTTLEYLWNNAVYDYHKLHKADSWPMLMKEVGEAVKQSQVETIYRYWFEALGGVGEIAYIQQQAGVGDDRWGVWAILQLLFQERRSKIAKQAIQDLKTEYPGLHESAVSLFESMVGQGKYGREIEQDRGPATLRESTK